MVRQFSLHLGVCVVDDGEEHVEEDEEDEEHIEDEVGRAEDTVRCLQLMEVEVTEDDSEQCEPEVIMHENIKFTTVFHQQCHRVLE